MKSGVTGINGRSNFFSMEKWQIIKEFLQFLGQRKKYWLLPIVIVLLLLGVLLVFAQGSVVAPFIYPLF